MNFFEAQDKARRHTALMVFLFILAVTALVLITNWLILVLVYYQQSGIITVNWDVLRQVFAWDVFWTSTAVVTLIILAGSVFKISLLAGGGRVVAEDLGGQLIPQNSQEPEHRKILNVVEEMAIASGSPVPQVYLLDEMGINAFAAGWRPSDAVIGITRGAVVNLSRDELQGVVAHEFSHIFNGDMRLNIRLIGVLNGILLLGIIGYYLMRSVRFMGRSRNRQGGNAVLVVLGLGLGLVIIGYTGTFFGNWIKAVVSRQREYLADASAVQFTRNRDGIAGALKKIGGLQFGSRLANPAAHEYSHAYFSAGVGSMLGFMFATHPPLKDRIRRVDPQWDGKFIEPQREAEPSPKTEQDKQAAREALLKTAVVAGMGQAVSEALQSVDKMGQPQDEELGYARVLLDKIPQTIKEELQDPYGARAVIYSLVIGKETGVQEKQFDRLQAQADTGVADKTRTLYPKLKPFIAAMRLPLIDLSFPALRALSPKQYELFRANLLALIKADNKVDFGEWVVQRLLLQQLDEAHGLRKPPKATISYIGGAKHECETVLSLVAYAEHKSDVEAQQAFAEGIKAIGATALSPVPRHDMSIQLLDASMDRLMLFKPLLKQRFLKALVACAATDQKLTLTGAELLRTIASCFHCPLPPLKWSDEAQ
jgi:Zn-dependent protease with chaperone function